jgi:hypothetical protein
MRGQPVARTVSWALLLLVVSSLLWTSAADEPNQAGVVVQFADGRVETRCVSFEEDEITGAELLALSGLDAVVDPSSGMGVTVCQIDGEGCFYPAEPCFCQCMGGGECAYWNYFYRDAGQAAWTYSALGAAIHKTKPGSVEGWVWGDGHSPPAEELTLEVICAAPSPEPTATSEPATAVPVTASASPSDTPGPTALPTDLPATTAPSPIPTRSDPAPSPTRPVPSPGPAMEQGAEPSSGPSSYLPFGLMVVGLAVIGGLVWLWRR